MEPVATTAPGIAEPRPDLSLEEAGRLPVADVLERLRSTPGGLTEVDAEARLRAWGPNSLGTTGVTALEVLRRQLRNPLLLLLGAAAIVSFGVGDRTNAAIILAISALSVGLSFFNEYRSERVAAELHARISHRELVERDGRVRQVDVSELVPGDVVRLEVGDIVPADLRLLEVSGLECDRTILSFKEARQPV